MLLAVDQKPTLPSASWGTLSRVYPARPLFPAFLLYLALPFSPFSHFTHLPPDALRKEIVSSSTITASSTVTTTSSLTKTSLPSLKTLSLPHAARCLGTSLRVYRTSIASSQLQQRERQWQRVYRERLTALKTQERNDRDRNTLNTANSLRVHTLQVVDSRQNLDANQSS